MILSLIVLSAHCDLQSRYALMGLLYSVSSFASFSIRRKDDFVNAGIGGLVTGACYGVYNASFHKGVVSGVVLACICSATSAIDSLHTEQVRSRKLKAERKAVLDN